MWGHISRAWKVMVKEFYQIPPHTKMKLLNSNIWWTEGVELLKHGFAHDKGLHLYRKWIRNVDDILDNANRNFFMWERAKGY